MIEISSIKPPTRQQFPTDALKMYENKRSKWLPFPKVQGNILPASTRETNGDVQTICFDIIQGNLSLIRFSVKPHVLEFTKDLN